MQERGAGGKMIEMSYSTQGLSICINLQIMYGRIITPQHRCMVQVSRGH